MDLDVKKHYPKDWIVLQNRVVECFRGMSLDEKRLFIMATPLARTTKYQAMILFLYLRVTFQRSVVLTYQRLIQL